MYFVQNRVCWLSFWGFYDARTVRDTDFIRALYVSKTFSLVDMYENDSVLRASRARCPMGQGPVALTVGSVPRRIVPELRHFRWLLKINNQSNWRNSGTILRGTDPTVSATAPQCPVGVQCSMGPAGRSVLRVPTWTVACQDSVVLSPRRSARNVCRAVVNTAPTIVSTSVSNGGAWKTMTNERRYPGSSRWSVGVC